MKKEELEKIIKKANIKEGNIVEITIRLHILRGMVFDNLKSYVGYVVSMGKFGEDDYTCPPKHPGLSDNEVEGQYGIEISPEEGEENFGKILYHNRTFFSEIYHCERLKPVHKRET